MINTLSNLNPDWLPFFQASSGSVGSPSLIPNYLRSPYLNYQVETEEVTSSDPRESGSIRLPPHPPVFSEISSPQKNLPKAVRILKVRLTGRPEFDIDFIEVDLACETLTFRKLVEVVCEEFSINPEAIVKLRKLPNTKLRRDIEVQRMNDYQEIEAVIVD